MGSKDFTVNFLMLGENDKGSETQRIHQSKSGTTVFEVDQELEEEQKEIGVVTDEKAGIHETSYEKAMELASFQPSSKKVDMEIASYEPSANHCMEETPVETHDDYFMPLVEKEHEASELPKVPSNVPTEVTEMQMHEPSIQRESLAPIELN
jgi:hypothetical protein